MDKITKKQKIILDAEFLAVPYLADQFIEELKIDCFSDIEQKKFCKMLKLARQFREYALGISTFKRKRLQSDSRHSGRREFRKD
jgi:hypothetical protein